MPMLPTDLARHRNTRALGYLFVSLTATLALGACGDEATTSDGGSPAQLTRIDAVEPGDVCAEGGLAVSTGVDANQDGTLEDDEVSSTQTVCNGADGVDGVDGEDGEDGASFLMETSEEPPGAHCQAGGFLVTSGLDADGDGALSDEEITHRDYVCHGVAGSGVAQLVSVMTEDAGDNCVAGGQAIRSGIDADGDGILQFEEIEQVQYVCNGVDGDATSAGLSSLIRQEDATAEECEFGGRLIHSGLDLDRDDYLDPEEIQATSPICNAAPVTASHASLFEITDVAPGDGCEAGGVLVETGVDTDDDGALSDAEVTNAQHLCHGAAGSGLTSVIEVQDLAAGEACPTGGVQINVGADANGNGAIDIGELTGTRYVCDGDGGHAALIQMSDEGPGSNCVNGGQRVRTGVDLNDDGELGRDEVTDTNFVCDGGEIATRVSSAEWGGTCQRGGVRLDAGLDDNGDGALDDAEIDTTTYACNRFITDVATGTHTCAVISDGTVWCWGSNVSGELGRGNADTLPHPVPLPIDDLANVTQVVAGEAHTCARLEDGTVWCWGDNQHGQLGNGGGADSPVPVQADTTGVAEITSRYYHTCARHADSSVSCWGNNGFGQIGNGLTTPAPSPLRITALGTTVAQISVGELHTCARTHSGSMYCWGYNEFGQLGDRSTTYRYAPVSVTGLPREVIHMAAGGYHTCAVTRDYDLWCWGLGTSMQLGDGAETWRDAPFNSGLTDIYRVYGGSFHTCAQHTDLETTTCFGRNDNGQVGTSLVSSSEAGHDLSFEAPTKIALGDDNSSVLDGDGTLWLWGDNDYGQLGTDSYDHHPWPAPIHWDAAP